MKKLIRKLTLFDKAIIVLAIFAFAFLAYIFFRKSTKINITVKVNEDDINYVQWAIFDKGSRSWFSHLFYVGMKEKGGLGDISAEVTDVYSYAISPGKEAVYLDVKLKTVFARSQNQHTYKGSPVLIGYPVKMYLDNVYVEGLVVDIEGVPDPREKETLEVEAKLLDYNTKFLETTGVEEFIADAISEGDKAKDNKNNTIIKVVNKRVENAKKVVSDASGRILTQRLPDRYDVYLTLEVNAIKISDKYFVFDDFPISIGGGIPINTSFYTISPVVSKITVK
jgi:hypothetical protein